MNPSELILYEEEELIVCRKPAGLPVQSARVGQMDMVSMLNNYLAEARREGKDRLSGENSGQAGGGEIPQIYVVHRLDQPVEGVLVFAKTKRAAASLSRQVSDGSMKKVYRAVCCVEGDESRAADFLEGQSYRLVDYLVKDGRTNTSSVAPQGSKGAKRAELIFHVVRRWERIPDRTSASDGENPAVSGTFAPDSGDSAAADRMSASDGENPAVGETSVPGGGKETKTCILAEIELKTGRHHQIRVQMAHAGLPLYGDQKYNAHWREYLTDRASEEPDPDGRPGRERIQLALCATALTFLHPVTGLEMTFRAEPQKQFCQEMV